MPYPIEHLGLYTDFYELSMAQAYFNRGKKNDQVTFDYFFRTNPFKGGFTVFAGLQDFLDLLERYTFSSSDLDYLSGLGFTSEFLQYLENFSFKGELNSVAEGEIVFPNEPVIRVEGSIIECQLIESMLLNIINFESLIATKAFRVKLVSGKQVFTDFGLRRAQGFGSLHASRAACIGGATATSNVLAGKLFQLPVTGTQSHSWIQSFDSELEAFREYALCNAGNTTLLVDTYNTLQSGVPNAIQVAREMEARGQQLKAIRLDSGDLAYLSKKARALLDEAGLPYVKIIASNQLNEYVIKSLLKDQEARIDAFGIGTELITGKTDAALDGVYKLAEINGSPRMKFSENVEKITLPGKKQVCRFFDENGKFYRDGVLSEHEDPKDVQFIFHPTLPEKKSEVKGLHSEKLLKPAVQNGKSILKNRPIKEIHKYLVNRAKQLPDEHKRFISPHIYKVGISESLKTTRSTLSGQLRNELNH